MLIDADWHWLSSQKLVDLVWPWLMFVDLGWSMLIVDDWPLASVADVGWCSSTMDDAGRTQLTVRLVLGWPWTTLHRIRSKVSPIAVEPDSLRKVFGEERPNERRQTHQYNTVYIGQGSFSGLLLYRDRLLLDRLGFLSRYLRTTFDHLLNAANPVIESSTAFLRLCRKINSYRFPCFGFSSGFRFRFSFKENWAITRYVRTWLWTVVITWLICIKVVVDLRPWLLTTLTGRPML